MIAGFAGEHRFLSNFFVLDEWIDFRGHKWATTEQAYQAAKLRDEDLEFMNEMDQNKITPGKAKRIGREIDIRPDWDKIKITVMTIISWEKFEKNPELMKLLQQTKGHELIELNSWNDTFWGQCPLGNGRNELGKILMNIRDGIA